MNIEAERLGGAAVDPLGLVVSVGTQVEQAGIDAFVNGLLSYDRCAADILTAAVAAPEGLLVNAYAAALWLMLEAPEGVERARPYARLASDAAVGTPRERQVAAFVQAWADGDLDVALATGEGLLQAWPRDLVTLKLMHYHLFNRGRFAEMLRLALVCRDAAADLAWAHGMAAFAYEQCHLLDEAEASARRALRLRRAEPWAQHALAHVMLTQGRIDEGVAFLESVQPGWVGLNSFMETHLWWHMALFRLSQGRDAEALRIYDEHAWAIERSYSQDQIGAVSLLARLELAQVDVGTRWLDLAGHLAVRAHDVGLPFLTLQYLYGLARADRPEAEILMEAIRTAARAEDGGWSEVGLGAAEGLLAQARGQAALAVAKLGPAIPRLIEVGGSHAQRDLFEIILLDAVMTSGALERAQQMLEARRVHDPLGAPVNRALARVYRQLGLQEAAAACATRVALRLAT